MEEWLEFNADRIRIASLITAGIVLIFAIYRWLLIRWRSDVNLRKYALFRSLPSNQLAPVQLLEVEVPVAQDIRLTLEQGDRVEAVLHEGEVAAGILQVRLDMRSHAAGDYSLVMHCDDQRMVKMVQWSGSSSVEQT